MMSQSLKSTCLILFFSLLTLQAFGQAQGPPPPNDPVAPFGFIEILIGAGALYGAKKAHDAKRRSSD